jgi:hypothetical protein
MDDNATKDWYLSITREKKLLLLESTLEKKEFGYFLTLSKWLLDAPISQGGIETDTIKSISDKYLNPKKI